MCSRYTLTHPDKIKERYDVVEREYDIAPNYNAAPTKIMPVIHGDGEDRLSF